jgi:hypothetical protein
MSTSEYLYNSSTREYSMQRNLYKKAMTETELIVLIIFIVVFIILVAAVKDKLGMILGF